MNSRAALRLLFLLLVPLGFSFACNKSKSTSFCGVKASVALSDGKPAPGALLAKTGTVLERRLVNVHGLGVVETSVKDGAIHLRVQKQEDQSLDAVQSRLREAVTSFRSVDFGFHQVVDGPATAALQEILGDEKFTAAPENAPHILDVTGHTPASLASALQTVPVPKTLKLLPDRTATKVYLVEAQAPLRARNVQHARAATDGTGRPVVSLTFDNKGAKLLEMVTKRAKGGFIAIAVDGEAINVPKVYEPLTSGKVQITFGTDATMADANRQVQDLVGALELARLGATRRIGLAVRSMETDCKR